MGGHRRNHKGAFTTVAATSAEVIAAAITIILLFCPHDVFSSTIAASTITPVPPPDENEASDPWTTYIIHVRPLPGTELPALPEHRESWYTSLLASVLTPAAEDRINHFYHHVATGFSVRLTEQELEAVEAADWFIRASPDHTLHFHTTHTPQFLGLTKMQQHRVVDSSVWKQSNYGEGMIIGIIDSGITPEHPSFHDDGTMPPPPARWKGRCDFIPSTLCNNKLIGARSFKTPPCRRRPSCNNINGTSSPFDEFGHGTKTASIAVGSPVRNASSFGQAGGTAVGMAPRAHLAVYQVGSTRDRDLFHSDVLAAMDAAVGDGVDIISASIARKVNASFSLVNDPAAVAGLSAVAKGVLVSTAAGNSGPAPSTVANLAPWVLTVGGSSMDRIVAAVVKLGSGREIDGQLLQQPQDFRPDMLPLVYGGNCLNFDKRVDIQGKIVLCEGLGDSGHAVKSYGGTAVIIMNPQELGSTTRANNGDDPVISAVSYIGFSDGNKIKAYINSTGYPEASISFKGTVTGRTRAPVVGCYSSRGPNPISPGILKPDIIGPGTDVLSAGLSEPFKMDTGTSYACPHLSGIAALLKSLHPSWSPAAIKSAIMTTADIQDNRGIPILDEKGLPAGPFEMGAGHVNVSRAANPGIIYDIEVGDYLSYLCGLNYTDRELQSIANDYTLSCRNMKSIAEEELNYPSISVPLIGGAAAAAIKFTVSRTVTNVGKPASRYWPEIDLPVGVLASVKPKRLLFTKVNEQQRYSVVFRSSGGGGATSNYSHGQLKWVSRNHVVRSPITIRFI